MVAFKPTVPKNLGYLQRQINAQGTGRLGPVSVGPGEGSIRFVDTQGRDLIRMTPDVVSVPVRGQHRSITESFETQITRSDAQDGRMDRMDASTAAGFAAASLRADNQDGRMDRIDGRVTTEVSRLDGDIALRPTHDVVGSWLQQRDVRMNGIDGRNDAQDGRMDRIDAAWKAGDAADQSRMDRMDSSYTAKISAAQSTADSGVSKANAAQSTANAAASAAAGAQGTANTARQEAARAQESANAVAARTEDIVRAINKLGSAVNTNPWA